MAEPTWRRKLPGRTLAMILGPVAVVFVGCCAIGDGVVLAKVPYLLVVGWAKFLARVVPRLDPSPGELAVAIVSLLVVVGGVHWLARWAKPGWPWRHTLRTVSLLVLMFVAGTAMIGITHQVGWLARGRLIDRSEKYDEHLAELLASGHLDQLGRSARAHWQTHGTYPGPVVYTRWATTPLLAHAPVAVPRNRVACTGGSDSTGRGTIRRTVMCAIPGGCISSILASR